MIGTNFRRAALALAAILQLTVGIHAFARGAGEWEPFIQNALNPRSPVQAVHQNEIIQLDRELTVLEDSENPHDAPVLQNKAARLATLFLMQKQPQDALWALRRGGLQDVADALEVALKSFLSQMDLANKVRVGIGVSASEFVTGGVNLRALLKRDPYWPDGVHFDVFAYEFDRFLGINRVPVTILRRNGNQDYSLQFVIEGAGGGVNYRGDYGPALPEVDEVFPFDFITEQADRHNGNNLTSFGRRVLIDNTRMFGCRGHMMTLQNYIARGGKINNRLLRRFYQITPQALHNRFDPIIGAARVDLAMGKIMEIKAAYPNPDRQAAAEMQRHVPPHVEVAIAVPGPQAAAVVRAPAIDIRGFEEILRQARRSENPVEKKRATKQVLAFLNDLPALNQILLQHGSERRLAHFFEENMAKIKPASVTKYVQFIKALPAPERAHLRIINGCQQLLAG